VADTPADVATVDEAALAVARNIVNQIGDVWHELIPSAEWVRVRQETNDECDKFVASLLAAHAARARAAALRSAAHSGYFGTHAQSTLLRLAERNA
jgi:hypothetical protein